MKKGAGGPSLHCTIPTEGAPSLRFFARVGGDAAAQLLSSLVYAIVVPALWWLLQFEGRATRLISSGDSIFQTVRGISWKVWNEPAKQESRGQGSYQLRRDEQRSVGRLDPGKSIR